MQDTSGHRNFHSWLSKFAYKRADFAKKQAWSNIKVGAIKSESVQEEVSIKRIKIKNSVSNTRHIFQSQTSSTTYSIHWSS
jgi:hypothetical protein